MNIIKFVVLSDPKRWKGMKTCKRRRIKTLPSEAHQYKDEWIALSHDESNVAGHGKTPEEAISLAENAGENNWILMFMPAKWPDILVM